MIVPFQVSSDGYLSLAGSVSLLIAVRGYLGAQGGEQGEIGGGGGRGGRPLDTTLSDLLIEDEELLLVLKAWLICQE